MYSSPMNWKGASSESSLPGNLAYLTPRMSWMGPLTQPGNKPSYSFRKARVKGNVPSLLRPPAVSQPKSTAVLITASLAFS